MRAARAAGAAAALTLAFAGGCSTPNGGTVVTTGLGDDPVRLESTFKGGYFSIEAAQTTVTLSSIPYEELARGTAVNGAFLHIEVLWRPKAGATAVVPSATNLSIRMVVVSNGEVGVYGGGGFGWIDDGTEDDTGIGIDITGSALSLLDRTPGFVDLLSPATVIGEVGAVKGVEEARAYIRAASQLVTNKLGRVRYVQWMAPGSALPLSAKWSLERGEG
ncbi:MAG: hypothetical protein JNK53_02935 [Phycisphaerae bacterium]|nr:hypothetical protein [Phycisphaerae bacterium]